MGKTAMVVGAVAGVGLLGAVGLVLYARTLPTRWRVEVAETIAASPQDLFPLLDSPKEWPAWLAGDGQGMEEAKYTYFGPERGPGAGYTWEAPKTEGRMTITEADPATGIAYEMSMEGDAAPAWGSLRFAPEGDGLRLTWIDEGDLGGLVVGGLLVGTMEASLSTHFRAAATKLKGLAEERARERESGAPPPSAGDGAGEAVSQPSP
ncbi:SRPBCC family protein [Myxococcota bacterium]|nr:SRPBCC family protein [Myxococcota bacterium]